MTDNKTLEMLMSLIDGAFSNHYSSKENEITPAPKEEITPKTPALYESIEDYTAKTGKRFRMTKDQKNLGMTREEAFNLTFGEY